MIEKLLPLNIPPGLSHNGTKYDASNRWYDANGVRFFRGSIRPIGGWATLTGSAVTGTPSAVLTGTYVQSSTPFNKVASRIIGTTAGLFLRQSVPFGNTTLTPAGFAGGGTWSLDTFGGYVIGCDSADSRVIVWPGDAALPADYAAGAPPCTAIVTTPERFLVALGAPAAGATTLDPRTVRWASQETTDDWEPLAGNTAGDFTLATRGEIRSGRRTRQETLVFTTVDVHAMSYIGGSLVYRIEQKGDNCGIIAPNAVAVVDTQAFWMGQNGFFRYDGYVRPLPCAVHDLVFGNIALNQRAWAMANTAFNEVWFFYSSAASSSCDQYVVYNYVEDHWTAGTLSRAAGVDADGTSANAPMMVGYDGLVYAHETGNTRPGMTISLESGPFELGDGDQVARLQWLLTDELTPGTLRATVLAAMGPDAAETTYGPYTLANPTPARLSARQVRLRFTEQTPDTGWRLGKTRLGVIASGRR